MEKTVEAIETDVATLREHVTNFRRLADEHRADGALVIADKLVEVAAELEAKATELERRLGRQC
jgi:hypothetical protein